MPLFANAHDRILRSLDRSTGKSFPQWRAELDGARLGRGNFVKALHYLQQQGIDHDESTAIAWSWMNPTLVPDELQVEGDPVKLTKRAASKSPAPKASAKKASTKKASTTRKPAKKARKR